MAADHFVHLEVFLLGLPLEAGDCSVQKQANRVALCRRLLLASFR